MKLPIIIDTNTTTGNLRIVDQNGYLYVTICANSTKGSKTLGVKTEDALDEKLDSYTETAKGFELELYNSCFDEAPSIEAGVLAIAINKFCSAKTKTAIKAEIQKGRVQETKNMVSGF